MSEAVFRWLPDAERPSWEAFARSCGAGLFAGGAWLRALAGAGVDVRVGICERGGEISGGAVFAARRRLGVGMLLPLPLTPYQGPWLKPRGVEDPAREERHGEEVLRILARGVEKGQDRVQMLCPPSLWDLRAFAREGWTASPRYTYLLGLDPAKAWLERMSPDVRRRARLAQEGGLRTWESTDWAGFHRLWAASLAHQGAPVCFDAPAFSALCETLQAGGLLSLRMAGPDPGRPWFAAAALTDGPDTYYWVAGALREHASSGGNQLLMLDLCEGLSAKGATRFDLVGGDLEGVGAYKRSLGGTLVLHFQVAKDVTALGGLAALAERAAWRV